jgi:hypothetical protein
LASVAIFIVAQLLIAAKWAALLIGAAYVVAF